MGRERLEDFEEHGGNLEQTVSRNMDFKDTAGEDPERTEWNLEEHAFETRRKEILVL